MQDGVLLMGIAAFVLLIYTRGSITALVIMYSINVFLTFSLSQFGMVRFYVKNRDKDRKWKQHIAIHIIGLLLCLTILSITIYEKFGEGGWVTLVITSFVIGFATLSRHYNKVGVAMRKLGEYCPIYLPPRLAITTRGPKKHDRYTSCERF